MWILLLVKPLPAILELTAISLYILALVTGDISNIAGDQASQPFPDCCLTPADHGLAHHDALSSWDHWRFSQHMCKLLEALWGKLSAVSPPDAGLPCSGVRETWNHMCTLHVGSEGGWSQLQVTWVQLAPGSHGGTDTGSGHEGMMGSIFKEKCTRAGKERAEP